VCAVQLLAKTRAVEREQAERVERDRLHNATYWIEKFMATAHSQTDPELAGHNEEHASPLAAVEAARWRKSLSEVQAEAAAAEETGLAAAAAAEAEHRARTEGAWTFVPEVVEQASQLHVTLRCANGMELQSGCVLVRCSTTRVPRLLHLCILRPQLVAKHNRHLTALSLHTGMAGLLGKAAASNWKRATFGADADAQAEVDWRALSLNIRAQRAAETHLSSTALTAATKLVAVAAAAEEVSTGAVAAASVATGLGRGDGRRASVASSGARRYNPDKAKLAKMAEALPADVSRTLRQQLTSRASIDTVLGQMEKVIAWQGPPRRLGRADSRQITRAINRSMMNGASKQVRSL
jgi:hypothetical protein